MKKQKRKRAETGDDAADDGAGGSCKQPAGTYMRLSSEMQRKLGGRIYCTEDEITKLVLIDRLLELGELKLVESVFDVNVQKMCGDTFDVQMGSDDNKVLSLKHKVKNKEGTSEDCIDLVLLDEAAKAAGKSEDEKAVVDVADRVALQDGAALLGACSVLLCVKESDMQRRLRQVTERKREAEPRTSAAEASKQAIAPGPVRVLSGDCVNGYGKQRTNVDGSTYEGQWQNVKPHGKGTMIIADGRMYKGGWREGKLRGTGTYYYPDGNMYEGEWRENRMHGNGTYYYDDGEMYNGQWADSKKNGNGTYYFANGEMHQGEWREGKKRGTGTTTFGQNGSTVAGWEWVKPGDVYHGPYVDDKMHGIGQWTHAKDGTTERVECENGTIVGWPDRT